MQRLDFLKKTDIQSRIGEIDSFELVYKDFCENIINNSLEINKNERIILYNEFSFVEHP